MEELGHIRRGGEHQDLGHDLNRQTSRAQQRQVWTWRGKKHRVRARRRRCLHLPGQRILQPARRLDGDLSHRAGAGEAVDVGPHDGDDGLADAHQRLVGVRRRATGQVAVVIQHLVAGLGARQRVPERGLGRVHDRGRDGGGDPDLVLEPHLLARTGVGEAHRDIEFVLIKARGAVERSHTKGRRPLPPGGGVGHDRAEIGLHHPPRVDAAHARAIGVVARPPACHERKREEQARGYQPRSSSQASAPP